MHKLILFLVLALSAGAKELRTDRVAVPAEEGERLGVYFSNGDNELIFSELPVDSPAVIDETLGLLKEVYGIDRVYWRLFQDMQLLDYQHQRTDNFWAHGVFDWWRYCMETLGTYEASARLTAKHGLGYWGIGSLFDHGAQADVVHGEVPNQSELHIRLDHPRWIPLDRAGIRRHPGPVSLAYPEARTALIEMYAAIADRLGIEGLVFHCYVENRGQRFDEEFGFEEPIAEEYLRRYGTDIRTEPYDLEKLVSLRGEYVTLFLAELRERFREMGVQVGVMLASDHPEQPHCWSHAWGAGAGLIRMDWRTWVDEGLVDELWVFRCGAPWATARTIRDYVDDRPVTVAVFSTGGWGTGNDDLPERGVRRVLWGGGYEDLEYGHFREHPVSALDGDDPAAKLSVISRMGIGWMEPDLDKLLDALRDPSILVRRRVLRTLYQLVRDDPSRATTEVREAVRSALDDPENIVRCTAFHTLGSFANQEDVEVLFRAIVQHGNTMMTFSSTLAPLSRAPEELTPALIEGLSHPSVEVRRATLRIFRAGTVRREALTAILECVHDEEPLIRWTAGMVLAERFGGDERTQQALLRMLDDPHPSVRNLGAARLSGLLRGETRWVGPLHLQFIEKLQARFLLFGEDGTEPDADWGWRPVGDALRRMGSRGTEFLQSCLAQTDDLLLADRAWRVLYVPFEGQAATPVDKEQAVRDYALHPTHRPTPPTPPPPPHAEPEWMPYITPDFTPSMKAGPDGHYGSLHNEFGSWRGLGPPSGESPHPNRLAPDPEDPDRLALCLLQSVEPRPEGASAFVQGLRTGYRVRQGGLQVAFEVFLTDASAGLTLWVSSSGRITGNLRLVIGPSGTMTWRDDQGRAGEAGQRIAAGRWVPVLLEADLDRQLFRITADGALLAEDIPLGGAEEFNSVFIWGGHPTTPAYLRGFEYRVTNPAFPGQAWDQGVEP